MKVLLRFAETADQYVPYLLRKAQHIEDYLQSYVVRHLSLVICTAANDQ